MTEFLRTQWTSLKAQEKWSPILSRISNEAARVEVETVRSGMRKLGVFSGSPELVRKVSKGFDSHVLGVMAKSKHYATSVQPYQPGEPFDLRTVVGPTEHVDKFVRALRDRDEFAMGRLLGYPECCINNFCYLWVERNLRDFTWESAKIKTNQNRCVVIPHTETNPMWVRLNIRAFYHIPCSYRCIETYNLTYDYRGLWDPKIWSDYMEVLSWPVEWSALHGAAEIRTPILKLVHDTEYTKEERIIQVFGTVYPEEGARTDCFPYDLKLNIAYNNGFQTVESMQKHHFPITAAAKDLMDVNSIYDPGCGNGQLLNHLSLHHPSAKLSGCDINEHAILEGRLFGENILLTQADMFDEKYPSADLIVLMPGRLAEVSEDKARAYVKSLVCKYLLLYVYGDHRKDLWPLREKFFPDAKVRRLEVSETTTALLLERQ